MKAPKPKCLSAKSPRPITTLGRNQQPRPLLVWILSGLLAGTTCTSAIDSVAHPEEPFATNQTVIWAPLFQASWDRLHENHQLLRVEPPNALMDKLDQFKWEPETVLPKSGWKIWAGAATADFIALANKEAKAYTNQETTFRAAPSPTARIALGVLQRRVDFVTAFYRSNVRPLPFLANGMPVPVQFFGVRGKLSAHFRGSVSVLNYEGHSHALKLFGKEDDSVILYLPPQPVSFQQASETIRTWLQAPRNGAFGALNDPSLHELDDVRVPYLSFNSELDFGERLHGGRFLAGEAQPWRILQALQRVDFELIETGAKVRVITQVAAEPFGGSSKEPIIVPRNFIYDRPFFLFLWRHNADWPYLGLWLGDTQAMHPFK